MSAPDDIFPALPWGVLARIEAALGLPGSADGWLTERQGPRGVTVVLSDRSDRMMAALADELNRQMPRPDELGRPPRRDLTRALTDALGPLTGGGRPRRPEGWIKGLKHRTRRPKPEGVRTAFVGGGAGSGSSGGVS